MLISQEWLAEYVALPAELSPHELAKKFSLATAEIEGVISEADAFENIVVGVIASVDAHPQADKLRLVHVNVGTGAPVQIVCGGTNLFVGEKVAVALPGARVQWHGQGELVTLAPTEIRGEKSFGMICAAAEIGLGAEFPAAGEREILDLTETCDDPAGTPLAEALRRTGVVFEIDNKSLSNRPDLWGHMGVAREFAALCKTTTMLPTPKKIIPGDTLQLTVNIADVNQVPRYTAAIVTGVAALPAAPFIQTRLRACGVTPINAIVDTLNYVMLETGQPLHAFDYDAIKEAEGSVMLEVRAAGAAEKFTTLGGAEISVPSDALMIANPARSLVVAGIIGGADAMVTNATHTIVLESAVFKAQSIRRTSNALGIRTESSARFEKGLDPEQTVFALARVVELLQQQFPHAVVASAVVDIHSAAHTTRELVVSEEYIRTQLGTNIPHDVVTHILHSLGFGVHHAAGAYTITVPSFRAKDIVGPEDIVEELVRLYGYSNIQAALPHAALRVIEQNAADVIAKKIKTHAALAEKFHEINHYAFVRPAAAEALGLQPDELLQLANPLSADRPIITPMLKINLLESVGAAQHTRVCVALFEIARVFAPHAQEEFIGGEAAKKIPSQPLQAAFVFADRDAANPFGILRDAVARTFFAAGHELTFAAPQTLYGWHEKQKSANIFCGETHVGSLGVVGKKAARAFGIAYETAVAEISLELVAQCSARPRVLQPASQFPAAQRDIACVFDESVVYEAVAAAVRAAAPEIVSVDCVDIYRNAEALGEQKKSFTLRVSYQSDSHTLSSEEIESAHSAALRILQKNFSAEIR